jgi:Holliday junction resolvasome RuvABC endonuclease subunit
VILGLDISTSITGFSVLDDSGDVVLCDFINLKKLTTMFDKARTVEHRLQEIFDNNKIEKVWIEESLQMFSSGMSSAKTLATLTKFNGIISWITWDKFNIQPEYIAAVSARKEIGLTVSKGQRGKDVVMKYMLDKESWFVVDYGRTGKIKPHFYDMADSFVVAKAGYLRCTNEKN